MFKTVANRLTRFWKDASGNMSIESVIFIPLILSIVAATFSFYDAFRFKSLNNKATYTISDALSRETAEITPKYLDGMVETLRYLTRSEGQYSLRVTLVRYDGNDEKYLVEWSQSRGGFQTLASDDLKKIESQLPHMLHNERVIVVETQTEYATPFPLNKFDTSGLFYNFAFTRPRFAPQLVWSDTEPGAA